jgi:IMP dehydrogenase
MYINLRAEKALSYDDLLLVPNYSEVKSRVSVKLTSDIGNYTTKIPIIASCMSTVTDHRMLIAMHKAGGFGIMHRFNSPLEQCEEIQKAKSAGVNLLAAAVGITGDYLTRAVWLSAAGARVICIDVAHGHHVLVKEAILKIKSYLPDIFLIAGNVATAEGFWDLSSWGADAVRIGVGGGSICSTRINTGSGIPTAQSIIDCDEISERKNLKTLIIADGGCTCSGDIVKALALGVDYVMLGSLLSGTFECPGPIICKGKRLYKRYAGMASERAQQNNTKGKVYSVEGVSTLVPYKGMVSNVLEKLTQNIKSGLSYSGANNLQELRVKAKFIQQTTLGAKETGLHIYDTKRK